MPIRGLVLLAAASALATLSLVGFDSEEGLQKMRVIDVCIGAMAGLGWHFLFVDPRGQVHGTRRFASWVGPICLGAFISGLLIAYHEAYWRVRTASGRITTTNYLKQLALAIYDYHDKHKKFPAAAICDKDGKPLLSWRVAILPYMEQSHLFDQFKLDEPWDSANNIKLLERMPRAFSRPGSSAKPGETHFRVFVGGGAGFEMCDALQSKDIKDGTGRTIMIVEAALSVPWTKPDELVYDPNAPLPDFGGRATTDYFHVAFFDTHVQTLPKSLAAQTMRALITRAAGDDTGGALIP